VLCHSGSPKVNAGQHAGGFVPFDPHEAAVSSTVNSPSVAKGLASKEISEHMFSRVAE
jgi:hypothetical protein